MDPAPQEPRSRKRFLLRLGGLLMALLVIYFSIPLPNEYKDLRQSISLQLLDRHGRPLRSQLSDRQGTDRWVSLDQISPHLIDAVLVAEDNRYQSHWGVDFVAVARAAGENLKAGQVVSGASTLTQQLLRTLRPAPERTWTQKLDEMFWATRLEWVYSKDEILEAYLNRVAFGPTVYGVEEASRYYFDKPARALSPSEASLLAVLIRAPATFDPFSDLGREELRRWSEPLLMEMAQRGLISQEAAERACSEEWELSSLAPPFQAPHFCDLVQRELQGHRGDQRTTLDLDLQGKVEGLVRTHLDLLKGHRVSNCAVVVAEVESGEVVAMVGSPDYHRRADGQYNAAVSYRQPGSTLKPFTYALLLEEVGQAGSLLPDLPLYESSDRESFIPKNYDEKFHGPVSIRTALGCSYNVPAVRALERVGVDTLLETLRRLGMDELTENPQHYGLGLTLGDGSVSLMQLVGAYRCLARGGLWSPLTLVARDSLEEQRILSPQTSFLITDVLSDHAARIPSFGTPNVLEFPYPVAVKTGTSRGYRDNWTVGYTPRYLVGVWVGNSDGTPMLDVSGITGAGPLFRDVMLTLGDGGDFVRPEGLSKQPICSMSGQEPNEECPHRSTEWRIIGKKLERCTACRSLEVDLRTGQLAESATPTQYRVQKFFYDLDPLYREWGQGQGLPLPPDAPTSQSDQFRLVYPLQDDVFLIDADLRNQFQRVMFRAVSGEPPYRWSLDGKVLSGEEGLSLWWVLERGEHTITIEDASGRTDSVRFGVRGQSL